MSQCSHCQAALGDRQLSLERRIEAMTFSGDNMSMQVLAAEEEMTFCTQTCWHRHLPQTIQELQLVSVFPLFSEISDCCRCGAPVDRRMAYVAYSLLDMTLNKKPWLTSCDVHSDEEFAVLCYQCAAPDFDKATAQAEDDESAQLKIGVVDRVEASI